MPNWDLANVENWQLLLSEKRLATAKTQPISGKNFFNPIPPVYANPNSNILLVGVQSEYAKPTWFLGARIAQFLYVSPSSYYNYTSGVQISNIRKIGLNRLTLIKFDDFDINEYVLEVAIPYWIQDIYVEVWQYLGDVRDSDEEWVSLVERLNSIESKLDSVEAKVNAQLSGGFGTQPNISTGFDNPDSSSNLGIL